MWLIASYQQRINPSLFPENIAFLDDGTKVIFADGTFKTAPSLKQGHFYQILMVHAEYRGHTFVMVKAFMTHKSGTLYNAVFARVKQLLPDSVNPDYVLSDYETALQNGLAIIFPDSVIVGCWFHFSQVRIIDVALKASF